MTARLVVCTTCRFSSEEPVDAEGLSGGQALLNAVMTAVEAAGADDLRVEEQTCLWACSSHCAVYLSQPGKPAYLAGRFAPTAPDAQAITDFARLYVDSPQGAVPYRDWPEGMKGHFIARLPAPRDS
jgi:predicted metal-binding protein